MRGGGERDEQALFEKIMKKVLGGDGKGITFAVRFREEKTIRPLGLKFYDIMSTKER